MKKYDWNRDDPYLAGSGEEPDFLRDFTGKAMKLPIREPGFCLIYLMLLSVIVMLVAIIFEAPIAVLSVLGFGPEFSWKWGGCCGLGFASVIAALIIANRLSAIGRMEEPNER